MAAERLDGRNNEQRYRNPVDLVEAIGRLRLPPRFDARLQELMDKNTEGRLSAPEQSDLEALVELSETIGILRARALHVLGQRPNGFQG